MTELAMDAKALIQHRIQEQGLNAEGQAFSSYSKTKLPLYFFDGKGNKKAQKALTKAQKLENAEGLSYEEWRRLNGRQTSHKDFTFTRGGAGMFGSTGVVSEVSSDGRIRVTVGGKDLFTQQKLDWNSEDEGTDLLDLTKKERALLAEKLNHFFQSLIQKHGLK